MSDVISGSRVWHYRPGPHWVVVAPTAAALLVGEPALELAERIWRLLDEPDGAVDRVLDELARHGLAGLPPFALVEISGTEVRAFARGTGVARVRTADGTHRAVAGAGVRSWREETISSVAELLLTDDGEPTGPRLPVGGGIVRASELTLVVDAGVEGSAQQPPADAAPAPGLPSVTRSAETGTGFPVPEPQPRAEPRPGPVAVEPHPEPDLVDSALTLDESDFDPDHGRHAAAVKSTQGPSPSPLDDEDPYIDLVIGRTELGTSAVAPDHDSPEPPPAPPQRPVPPPPAVEPVRHHAPSSPPRPTPPPSPTPGLISSMPFRSGRSTRRAPAQPAPQPPRRPAAPPAQGPPPSSAVVAHDEDTDITVMKVSTDRSRDGSSGSSTGWLPSAVCGGGHPNPPEAERCRVCRADLSAAVHQLVERPVLGRLRFDSGHGVVDVTGPMVIGRKPRADRVPGNAVPAMVTIPDDDISKSHLRITVQGWHVVVEDLTSTNGTWVYGPDGEGHRLDPDQETPLAPGSRVVMAETVGFVYEVQP